MCIKWNKSVRKIVELPNNSHRSILGPLPNQPQISYQLFIDVFIINDLTISLIIFLFTNLIIFTTFMFIYKYVN